MNANIRAWWLNSLFLAVWAVASCSGTSTPGEDGVSQDLVPSEAAQDSQEPDTNCLSGDCFADDLSQNNTPLTGVWAQKMVLGSMALLPVVGPTPRSSSTYQMVTFVQDGDKVTSMVDTCTVVLDSGTTLSTSTLPQAVSDAIPDSPRSATIEGFDDGGRLYHQQTYADVRGARLDNPDSDPLPTDASDPRVVDIDKDGHPGITVVLTGSLNGDIYLVQRLTVTLSGIYEAPDSLTGSVVFVEEQSILGASADVLADPIESNQDPDPTKSWFESVRVHDDADCAWLMENRKTVFAED